MDRIEDYTDCLSAFVDAIGATDPIPCGLSIGGAIALQLLLDHSEMFPAGILVSTGARLRVLPTILEQVQIDYTGFLGVLSEVAASEKTDPAKLAPILDVTADCPVEVVLGDFQACDRFDVMDRLAEIAVPVLVICAEDDRLTPPKYGEFLEAKVRNARRVLIPDAGHLVPVEQPAAVNQAIRRFIQDHFQMGTSIG